jgi:Ca2+-binding EF-hand superfamily protein
MIDSEIAAEAFENMKNFIDSANFKKAALVYLASKMPEKNIDELRKLFIQIDSNGDGKITADEFWKALKAYGFDYSLDEA